MSLLLALSTVRAVAGFIILRARPKKTKHGMECNDSFRAPIREYTSMDPSL